MYISIYSKNKIYGKRQHLANLSHITYDMTLRTFDFNTLQADGYTDDDFSNGIVYVINDDNGRHLYSGFCKNAQRDGSISSNKWSFKGDDFRRIFDTEILLDYSQDEVHDFTVSGIFNKVVNLVTTSTDQDPELEVFDIQVIVPTDTRDASFVGDYTGQYFIENAYSFLKVYLSYFEYYISSRYDVVNDRIVFEFVRATGEESIKLKDFLYSRTTTDISLNKAIATVKFETRQGKKEGDVIVEEQGEEPTPEEEEIIVPRPSTLPTKYYYLTKDNKIYEDILPESANRVYPVRCKIFEDEFLSKAQYNAVSELVNSRYSEDIRITTDDIYNPIDLAPINLFTQVNVYTDEGFYKKLPVAEKHIKYTLKEKATVIKLGFKKTLLTEIIKGGNRNA